MFICILQNCPLKLTKDSVWAWRHSHRYHSHVIQNVIRCDTSYKMSNSTIKSIEVNKSINIKLPASFIPAK